MYAALSYSVSYYLKWYSSTNQFVGSKLRLRSEARRTEVS
jgi:hypothetical protein